MNIRSTLRLVSRLGASGIMVAGMSLAGAGGALAGPITPDSVNPWQHILDCWGAMIHDSASHQASCGPGQPGSNSTLATPVPGGSTCAPVVGSIIPRFLPFKTASLDLGGPQPGLTPNELLLAYPASCCHDASLTMPSSPGNLVASLDDSILPSRPASFGTVQHLAVTCCFSELETPQTAIYDLASLDDSIAPENPASGTAGSLLATPCV